MKERPIKSKVSVLIGHPTRGGNTGRAGIKLAGWGHWH